MVCDVRKMKQMQQNLIKNNEDLKNAKWLFHTLQIAKGKKIWFNFTYYFIISSLLLEA